MRGPFDVHIEDFAADISFTGGFQEQLVKIQNRKTLRYSSQNQRQYMRKKTLMVLLPFLQPNWVNQVFQLFSIAKMTLRNRTHQVSDVRYDFSKI
jgi:hypothetical protein